MLSDNSLDASGESSFLKLLGAGAACSDSRRHVTSAVITRKKATSHTTHEAGSTFDDLTPRRAG